VTTQTATLPGAMPAAPEPVPHTWTERWLGQTASPSWSSEARRLLLAAALAAAFGAALGLRKGGAAILLAALGAPSGIVAVAAVAVPAFAIVLALANAPIEAMDLAHATSRAAARAGLFLAGIAPGAALLAVTCEDAITVSVLGFGGLALAGGIAAHAFASALGPRLADAPRLTRAIMWWAMPAFLLFSAVLAARVWWLALPLLTELS
jgi:hypothetical protein